MKFSLCMIVKNEEAVLARCLDGVKGIFDEIIIVDTGSADATKSIASAYTDKIFNYTWCNGNYPCDWVLSEACRRHCNAFTQRRSD